MNDNKALLKGNTIMLVLNLLSTSDMYGYQMIKELEKRSDSTFTLKEGTLYPILHELESKGMIKSYWEDTESTRKRKYYNITTDGKKILSQKQKEWKVYSNAINKVMGGEYVE